METLAWRLVKWFVAQIGLTTLASLSLLFIGLGAAANGLSELVRDVDNQPLMLSAFAGVLLGWLLARSRLRAWAASLLALFFSVFTSLVYVARAGDLAIALFRTNLQIAWSFTRALLVEFSIQPSLDLTPSLRWTALLAQSLGGLLQRLVLWARAVTAAMPAVDPVVVTLVWSLVLWGVTIWAGWFTRRRNQPMLGLLPVVALLAYNIYYTDATPHSLAVLVGSTILLQVLHSAIAREQQWQHNRIDVTDIYLELGLTTIFITILLMGFSVLTPSLSVKQVVETVRDIFTVEDAPPDTLAESLGLQSQVKPGSPFQDARASGLPTQRLLGSGPELSQNLVMRVSLEGYFPFNPAISQMPWLQFPPHYYYRSLVYDRYNGRGWFTTPTTEKDYAAGEIVNAETILQASGAFNYVRQHITEIRPLIFLYATGELITADHKFKVAWRSNEDALGAQIDSSNYWVTSRTPVVSAVQLRRAGTDYPEWVSQRYLTLPDSLPIRVRSLALDLTVSQPTPYDRAIAIESYLRTYPYTLDLPAPPVGKDVVDYFLFDIKQGYCDYFSSAMVVLARAAGLPARVVSGFAGGNYDPLSAWFNISEADAHAWAEIYFPGYGWIEFEPTSGRPSIIRPEEIPAFNTPELPVELAPGRQLIAKPLPINLPSSLMLLCFIAAVLYLWHHIDLWRLHALSPSRSVAILYRRLARLGAGLSTPLVTTNTPAEYALRLTSHLQGLAQSSSRQAALTWIDQQVTSLANLYAQAMYSPHPPERQAKDQLVNDWTRLRTNLWLARLWRRSNPH